MSEQTHQSDPRVLSSRTLERNHRRLAPLIRPGMAVLDVGCGTGAITAGIARLAGPDGQVLGIDRDESLLAIARQEHQAMPHLSFEPGDALSMPYEDRFDIVTAARTLQWISRPDEALARMQRAAKAGGHIVVLDYNHEDNSWKPAPPAEFVHFYDAFLRWRTANQWNNRMADCLPSLFRSAGLEEIQIHVDDEVTRRGDPDFADRSAIWTHVVQSLGPRLVEAGYLTEAERAETERVYREWVQGSLQVQTLAMKTVQGMLW
jgi:SAM-dependent methyltransferase